jgi:Lsr2
VNRKVHSVFHVDQQRRIEAAEWVFAGAGQRCGDGFEVLAVRLDGVRWGFANRSISQEVGEPAREASVAGCCGADRRTAPAWHVLINIHGIVGWTKSGSSQLQEKEQIVAERIIRQLFDDLDQTEILDGKGGSVEFALRGTTYTIDLNDANIAKLDKAFAPFVKAAVTAEESSAPGAKSDRSKPAPVGTKRRGKRRPNHAGASSTATVRAWAAENGHDVSARGRIPAAVSEAYDAAHKPGK